MLHHEEVVSFIVCKDWGAAADHLAREVYKDRFWRMGARQQTAIMTPIARHMIIEYMQLTRWNSVSLHDPLPVEFAEQLFENTYSLLAAEAIYSGQQPEENRSNLSDHGFEEAVERTLG